MNTHTLNAGAILAASISSFAIGGLWYWPVLMGAAWKWANGLSVEFHMGGGSKLSDLASLRNAASSRVGGMALGGDGWLVAGKFASG